MESVVFFGLLLLFLRAPLLLVFYFIICKLKTKNDRTQNANLNPKISWLPTVLKQRLILGNHWFYWFVCSFKQVENAHHFIFILTHHSQHLKMMQNIQKKNMKQKPNKAKNSHEIHVNATPIFSSEFALNSVCFC